MPTGVSKCSVRVRQAVEFFAGFLSVCMPVIKKKIVKHPGSCRRSTVQVQGTAPFIIKICNMSAVVVTVCFSMMRKLFHASYGRMS